MAENSQPMEAASPLKQLLADLDASRAAKADDETLNALEMRLSQMTPIEEDDVFTLMGRLADKKLSPDTRARISENIGKVAPYLSARYRRLSIWTQLREAAIANFRMQSADAKNRLNKAASLVSITQMTLAQLGELDAGNNVALGLKQILGDARNDIAAATALLQATSEKLDEHLPLLKQFEEQTNAEEQLFQQSVASPIQ